MRRSFRDQTIKTLSGLSLLLFIFHFGGSICAFGKSLQKYREDVTTVKNNLTHLYSFSESDYNAGWTREQQLRAENDFFTQLSEYLPQRETVEWEGATTEVDNRWLHERVGALQKTARNSPERDLITTEIHFRLSALEGRLEELLRP